MSPFLLHSHNIPSAFVHNPSQMLNGDRKICMRQNISQRESETKTKQTLYDPKKREITNKNPKKTRGKKAK